MKSPVGPRFAAGAIIRSVSIHARAVMDRVKSKATHPGAMARAVNDLATLLLREHVTSDLLAVTAVLALAFFLGMVVGKVI